jgi:hypothetical protein
LFAAVIIRLALVATRVGNPMRFSKGVSIIWINAKGPVRIISGSFGNTISPYDIVSICIDEQFMVDNQSKYAGFISGNRVLK